MTRFSWKDAPDLMDRLSLAQNHPANVNQDIMTFAAFMDSRAELELHVSRAEVSAANFDQDREMNKRSHKRAA